MLERPTAVGALAIALAMPTARGAAQSFPAEAEQPYPTRPLRVLAGVPGSMMDVVLRRLTPRLSERLGQHVIVENRSQGTAAVVATQATPDGCTLLQADQTVLAVRPSLLKRPPYNPLRDFTPITLVAAAPSLLVAHASVPADNAREFMTYARNRAGGIDFATGGPATASHLMAELFKRAAGLNIVSINYKGGGAAIVAIASGETMAGFNLAPIAIAHVKTGKIKAYAVTSAKRFELVPDLPTLVELGMPQLVMNYWFGILAPARTPGTRVARLNHEIVAVLRAPEFKSALLVQGAEPTPTTPEEFSAFLHSETTRLKQVIDRAGLRAD